MRTATDAPLSRAVVSWVQTQIGPNARITSTTRLRGGISSMVDLLTVSNGARTIEIVMRRFANVWDSTPAAELIRFEAEVLQGLTEAPSLPVPLVVAADPEGALTDGVPALLMTRLPGAPALCAAPAEGRLARMAVVLARIHRLEVTVPPYQRWFDTEALRPPAWSRRPEAWQRAIDALREQSTIPREVFLHGDFQHFNLLWSAYEISGLVDWAGARRGPPEVDVSHCALNLAVLCTPHDAELFRRFYEAEAGHETDPVLELAGLFNYGEAWKEFIPIQVDGRTSVDLDGMDERVDSLLRQTLARC